MVETNADQDLRKKGFMYQAGGTHPKCKEFINSVWWTDLGIMENLRVLAEKAESWNKECFGNIFHMKKKLLARLVGIQKVREMHATASLRRLETEIREELERVLTQEELLYTQKQGAA